MEENLKQQVDEIIESDNVKYPVTYTNSEETLLSIFIQDEDCASYIVQKKLDANHFLKQKNRFLYNLLYKMKLSGRTINFDLVAQECEKEVLNDSRTLLDVIGGLQEFTRMMHLTDTNAIDLKVAEEYVRVIKEQYKTNQIKKICKQLAEASRYEEDKVVDRISALQRIIQEEDDKYGLISFPDLIVESFNAAKDRKIHPENVPGIRSRFVWLTYTKAIRKKGICVIGAKTSFGKSAFVGNIIVDMALHGKHTLIFTPEMDRTSYVDRMICSEAGIRVRQWGDGQGTEDEFARFARFKNVVLASAFDKLYIEDRGMQSCDFILTSIKRHMLNHPVDVVVIDYLQTLQYYGAETKKAITDMMIKFRAFAKDNDIAMIIISQLRRSDKAEPTINDLKESGDIENLADSIVLLHRDSLTNIKQKETGWYQVAKNRLGETTQTVALRLYAEFMRFEEMEPGDDSTAMNGYTPPDILELEEPVTTEQKVIKMVEEKDRGLNGDNQG